MAYIHNTTGSAKYYSGDEYLDSAFTLINESHRLELSRDEVLLHDIADPAINISISADGINDLDNVSDQWLVLTSGLDKKMLLVDDLGNPITAITGAQGVQGDQGIQGVAGNTGPAGADGIVALSEVYDSLAYTVYEDATDFSTTDPNDVLAYSYTTPTLDANATYEVEMIMHTVGTVYNEYTGLSPYVDDGGGFVLQKFYWYSPISPAASTNTNQRVPVNLKFRLTTTTAQTFDLEMRVQNDGAGTISITDFEIIHRRVK